MGKHDEAWMVLKHIHDTNMRARGEPERVFTVSVRPLDTSPRGSSSTAAGDGSVSPPAGEQDKDPQAAGRVGGDAERDDQSRPQGLLQDQGRVQRSKTSLRVALVMFHLGFNLKVDCLVATDLVHL